MWSIANSAIKVLRETSRADNGSALDIFKRALTLQSQKAHTIKKGDPVFRNPGAGAHPMWVAQQVDHKDWTRTAKIPAAGAAQLLGRKRSGRPAGTVL